VGRLSKICGVLGIDVRPFTSRADYEGVLDYFFGADEAFLRGMGVDPANLPTRESWLDKLLPDLDREDRNKQTYYLGWIKNGTPVGHCNVNKIKYGQEAYLHLHMWDWAFRRSGLGAQLVRQSANTFLRKFELQRLYCEPYADNPAPNRLLAKLGFRLLKRYRTTPGTINFEQDVNQYVIEHEIPG
jgi:RimJ/RimL family protein N-acetyltransferase